ncbi:putative nicotinate-nucleotide adenylyltransferase [Jeotgalicoccus coquinae]|uniref:Probable nicotinate-nucleotide adenylyltransferase n=1 Tax=Jeotgalicoccus coquinae TaxID=709509 RepID=A0A6V7RAA4_9STAP|nr:nicotinate (nicotinamide) nucleotide adenylyltransferase [Jeotgalicoccus coquinae]MBB6422815.1 nicotinate-nucleotide adenylyltransferase [Jeotgalicoccus coquinae]GGE12946.1 putative nicotinate-nucleotide adenylyltransferase [Jeotgalicoccus coquinae]CAD2074103.1 Nicotinate-nucleotide adenylyltransferase [Jeotgalicoccus coquinae]
MKIGVFGGTFDPVHNGHINAFAETYIALELDKVIIVPTFISPFKKQTGSTDRHRLNMLKLAVKNYDFAEIDTFELDQQKVTYTYDTLNYLREKYPGDELYFIIGTDHFISFDKWANADKLHDLAKFVVLDRNDGLYNVKPPFIKLNTNIVEVSSTLIRERFKSNTEVRHLMHEQVYGYIKEQRLYET